jgi:glycosyltransferase involved in cell wall biosynthesis
MKIIFTFGGLPHYYNYVLNRLNNLPSTEVKVIIPAKKSKSLGKGVHESDSEITFGVIPLEEEKAWYGKLQFKNFIKTIEDEKPDVIVTIWPYVLGFVLNPGWWSARKKYGFRLIYKDIPFNIPRYGEALKFYRNGLNQEQLSGTSVKWGPDKVIYYSFLIEIIKCFLRLMDAHVYYTEDAFDIIPTYGVDPKKIFITYNSPDTDRLFETRARIESGGFQPDKNKKIILHIGRLVAWKKVDKLILAYSIILKNHPGSELWIVGDGPESENLKKLAVDSGISRGVKFLGAIYEPEELGKITLSATVYVLAGMGGLSINEAMAFGKPVICTRADGTEKKLVRDGYNGYYFEEDNEKDLAEKIGNLLSDPEKARDFGENSTRIIKNEVNIQVVIDGYRRAFDFVTKQSHQ